MDIAMNNDSSASCTSLQGVRQAMAGAPTSLRDYLRVLAAADRLVRVGESISWRFEIGRTTRENRVPLLFERIEDYPGRSVFTNGLRNRELIALALGLEQGISSLDLINEFRQRSFNRSCPRVVDSGPLRENILPADRVNLLELPIPHWNECDIGRYLGTWHINVTKDPETAIRNVGIYRMQLLGSRHATVSTSARSDLARHIALAERTSQPLAMAVAIGVSEATIMAAAAGCPYGVDEYELAGGLEQAPLELIRCQTVDLEVPANSEIVIEGYIEPHIRVQDGPYFDYTGTTSTNPNAFLFEVTGMMFRNNFIFRGTSIGVAGAEDHQLFAILSELKLLDFHGSTVKRHIQDQILKQRLLRWIESGR